ncbi:hypothetical protein GCM10009799_00830 [Nocardiopsis rhodophaea]|uniref:Uncharacterized protein n=1 Tax=Nocardiopsis rhodophaea TaxID=280238 RepID=A0ABN2S311_9ACTN
MWAVVTSGSRFVSATRLDAVGIPTPPALVTADDVALGKPNPEGYLSAAQALKAPPTKCVVADAVSGAQAALATGMRAIGVEGGGPRSDDGVEFLVRDLHRLRIDQAPDLRRLLVGP